MAKDTLVVHSSVQADTSITRTLVAELVTELKQRKQVAQVVERDLAKNDLALLTADHVAAFYTPSDQRSDAQVQILQQSDALLAELRSVQQVIIGVPMYNFSVPAALKAWIDLICRVGESFRYGAAGPEGLLDIEHAYIVAATGGTPVESEMDFVVPYLKQVLGFVGVKAVTVIKADLSAKNRDASLALAREQIAGVLK